MVIETIGRHVMLITRCINDLLAYKLSDDGVTMDFSQPTREGDALIQVSQSIESTIRTFVADGGNSNVQFIVRASKFPLKMI